jgi:hypothetical protein
MSVCAFPGISRVFRKLYTYHLSSRVFSTDFLYLYDDAKINNM